METHEIERIFIMSTNHNFTYFLNCYTSVGSVEDLRWTKLGNQRYLSSRTHTIKSDDNHFYMTKEVRVNSFGVYTCINLFNGVEASINVTGGNIYEELQLLKLQLNMLGIKSPIYTTLLIHISIRTPIQIVLCVHDLEVWIQNPDQSRLFTQIVDLYPDTDINRA